MGTDGSLLVLVFAMSTSYMVLTLLGLVLLSYVVIRLWLTRGRRAARHERWDGGLRRLRPEMSYTATVEDTRETVAQHFRMAIRREHQSVHIVDRLLLRPAKKQGHEIGRPRGGNAPRVHQCVYRLRVARLVGGTGGGIGRSDARKRAFEFALQLAADDGAAGFALALPGLPFSYRTGGTSGRPPQRTSSTRSTCVPTTAWRSPVSRS